MQKPRRPFDIALLALYLAIGLPLVVLMFGAIRTRQLQSKSNPRWAQFAKVTGPAASTDVSDEVSTNDSNRLVVRTASVVTESSSESAPVRATVPARPTLPDPDLTGSVCGHLSLNVRVQSAPLPQAPQSSTDETPPSAPCTTVIHTPIIFRPLEDDDVDPPAQVNQSSSQLNAHLANVQKQLDLLAHRQQEQDAEQLQRESRLLDALTELRDVVITETLVAQVQTRKAPVAESDPDDEITKHPQRDQMPPTDSRKRFIPVISPDEPASPVRPEQPAPPVHVEQPTATAEPQAPQLQAAPELPPAIALPPQDQTIQIRREHGQGLADVFTIEAKDADIREFFVKLSESAQISILPSSEVNGRISLNLHSVQFEPALRAILKSRNYVYERDGDIIMISTADEVARLKQLNRKLFVKIYQPSYLSAAQLCRLIEPLLSADGRHSAVTTPNPSLLQSDELETDEIQQRDTVVVQDSPEVLGQVDQVLVEMDVPPLQVMIEAKILCVRLAGRWEHGVDLGLLPCQPNSAMTSAPCGLKHARLSCNVPTFIHAIERVADTSVVTSQRIQVLNKHRAEMLIGDRIGYQKRSGDSIQFMESGTRLIFRPTISADGCVRLEVHPERDTLKFNRKSKLSQQTAAELTTQVLVHDGATVAIGGLIAEQIKEPGNHASRKSSIPLIGASLRRREEDLIRTELVVLVTPHIVTDCMTAQNEIQPPPSPDSAATTRKDPTTANRLQLAKAHYHRASNYVQQGNPVKARQHIEASLRLNASDPDSQRLRGEIIQCFMRSPGQ